MSVREILIAPHPFLKRKAVGVASFGEETAALAADLIETMRHEKGYGLAAPQIHVGLRAFALEVGVMAQDQQAPAHVRLWVDRFGEAAVLVNPVILEAYGPEILYEEGCLSVPDLREPVLRPQQILVGFQSPDGETYEMKADGVLAVAIQHEMDHLDGKIFLDRLSSLKRNLMMRKLEKIKADIERDRARAAKKAATPARAV